MKNITTIYYSHPLNLNKTYYQCENRRLGSCSVEADKVAAKVEELRSKGYEVLYAYNNIGKRVAL